MKLLILVRGLPGSGKSTLASDLRDSFGHKASHYEADMFFTTADGKYKFDPTMLSAAHQWCRLMAEKDMRAGNKDTIIVSNTFSERWEMDPYITMANLHGFRIQIIETYGDFGSVHNVPKDTIDKMKKRWYNISHDFDIYKEQQHAA